ncbi:MAG: DUF6210 family protein [Candidatus Paraimprobicoccus trichonymphae]|uniref:DUF6210 family protein n=1 Tax=Candidatus Paraimprobicoccus trichonymphae TaxID=3033793 RepID=A0AA48HZ58_9FIRM|nr:MAG: DUF6210 family protein [Candidatus Paraimprobicoccus trichonymphae]
MEKIEKRICLYGLKQLALILLSPTGFIYYNQAGGVNCYQMEAEGTLVFVDSCENLFKLISKYTINKDKFCLKDADYLDKVFKNSDSGNYLKVYRENLNFSMEAWIYVSIDFSSKNLTFSGINCENGILTWDNSD